MSDRPLAIRSEITGALASCLVVAELSPLQLPESVVCSFLDTLHQVTNAATYAVDGTIFAAQVSLLYGRLIHLAKLPEPHYFSQALRQAAWKQ